MSGWIRIGNDVIDSSWLPFGNRFIGYGVPFISFDGEMFNVVCSA